MKLGENAFFTQAMKKTEAYFFWMLLYVLWSKIFLVKYVQNWLRNKTIKCHTLYVYSVESERSLKAKTSEDFYVHQAA